MYIAADPPFFEMLLAIREVQMSSYRTGRAQMEWQMLFLDMFFALGDLPISFI